MSAKVIAVANAAGSAGKSTTVVSLATILGQQGYKVVVVDGDAQATASDWLGVTNEATHTTGDVLLRRASAAEAIVATATSGVYAIAASRDLDADLVELAHAVGAEQRLKQALASVDADVVIIDCPGSISAVTIAALVAATHVITVTQPTMKEMRGIDDLQAVVADVAEAYNPDLALAAIIPCIVPGANAGKLYSDALALLADTYGPLVAPPIRRTAKVPEAHARSLPPPSYPPADRAALDYLAVLTWLQQRGIL